MLALWGGSGDGDMEAPPVQSLLRPLADTGCCSWALGNVPVPTCPCHSPETPQTTRELCGEQGSTNQTLMLLHHQLLSPKKLFLFPFLYPEGIGQSHGNQPFRVAVIWSIQLKSSIRKPGPFTSCVSLQRRNLASTDAVKLPLTELFWDDVQGAQSTESLAA